METEIYIFVSNNIFLLLDEFERSIISATSPMFFHEALSENKRERERCFYLSSIDLHIIKKPAIAYFNPYIGLCQL